MINEKKVQEQADQYIEKYVTSRIRVNSSKEQKKDVLRTALELLFKDMDHIIYKMNDDGTCKENSKGLCKINVFGIILHLGQLIATYIAQRQIQRELKKLD
jgi:hypothetical protein